MGRKLTTSNFKEKAILIHGAKFDYSEVNYINAISKVRIICRTHGEFNQSPASHLSGRGCKKCAHDKPRINALNTNSFIKKAIKVHGDRFDYSKVNYVNSKSKVKILCRIHGEFNQNASSHLMGYGCRKCADEIPRSHKLNTFSFIEKAIKLHETKYDYSFVKYKNNKLKVIINCPKHGLFKQSPGDHLTGKGCISCGREKTIFSRKIGKKEFIKRALKVHDNYYDYSEVQYKNTSTEISIMCPKHGFFKQKPEFHLSGRGCNGCGREKTIFSRKIGKKEFIKRCVESHGLKYDYSECSFKTVDKKVKIKCPIHSFFIQLANSHMRGAGCPKCNTSKGEKKILDLLANCSIKSEPQKTFNGCRSKNLLKFDFYLPNYKLAIEYQGEQHYMSVNFFGGMKKFKESQKRDQIKRDFCFRKGIKLLEIPYWDFDNIEAILNKELLSIKPNHSFRRQLSLF